jgi:chaperonin GroES
MNIDWKFSRDRVLVKQEKSKEVTDGGILLPDQVQKEELVGVVVAAGLPKFSFHGELMCDPVEVGNTVLFSRFGGAPIELDNEEYRLLRYDDIIAVK